MTTENSIAELSKTFRLNSSEIANWQYIKDKKRREEARKMALEIDLLDIQADMFGIDPKRQIQIEKQLQKN